MFPAGFVHGGPRPHLHGPPLPQHPSEDWLLAVPVVSAALDDGQAAARSGNSGSSEKSERGFEQPSLLPDATAQLVVESVTCGRPAPRARVLLTTRPRAPCVLSQVLAQTFSPHKSGVAAGAPLVLEANSTLGSSARSCVRAAVVDDGESPLPPPTCWALHPISKRMLGDVNPFQKESAAAAFWKGLPKSPKMMKYEDYCQGGSADVRIQGAFESLSIVEKVVGLLPVLPVSNAPALLFLMQWVDHCHCYAHVHPYHAFLSWSSGYHKRVLPDAACCACRKLRKPGSMTHTTDP